MTDHEADISHHFADLASTTRYDDLGPEAVDAAKKCILDTIGVILAAGGIEPAVRACVELVEETGGQAEASILGRPTRVPAIGAAFANGAMAHCLDFDDRTPWGQHGGSSIVPAVLAAAERRASSMDGVTGAQLITAVAVGQDVYARLRRYTGWRKDWNMSTVLGVYAATAGCCRVLELTTEQAHSALGIASQESAGVHEVVAGTGSNLRGMYAGFSAKGAVLASLLAQRGVTGVDRLFEGPTGVFATYFGGDYDREGMLRHLGDDYRGPTTLYKMWPAVGTSHNHVHATLQLMAEHELTPDDIDEIRVHVGDYHRMMCDPIESRRSPATLVDAKFSLPFIVATAAVRRGLGVGDFTESALGDRQVLAMAQRVVPVDDPDLDWALELPPARVRIHTRDGRAFERAEGDHPGSEASPMTWAQLTDKFAACVAVAGTPLGSRQAEEFARATRDLERADAIDDYLSGLQPATD